ncbi:MAG TPA: (5-formylfuran-3-yl)methyl phosphate synthase, partial [Methylosinus sp.]
MTLMLTSVASVAEAEIVLSGGADLIDCKDAARGALGALPPQ